MKKLIVFMSLALLFETATAGAAILTYGRTGAAMNKQQCKTAWQAASADGRYLDRASAVPYIVNFPLADGADQDGRISKREFKKACKKGLVKFPIG